MSVQEIKQQIAGLSSDDQAQLESYLKTMRVIDLGEFVLTFWSDHAARMVRILTLERVQ